MQRFIKVQFQVEGVHRWSNCPFEDVSFLRNWHRHMFHFEVKMEVSHSDRDIEFIRVKRELEYFVSSTVLADPVEFSCEALSEIVLDFCLNAYGQRQIEVWCFEDGENGGGVRWTQ